MISRFEDEGEGKGRDEQLVGVDDSTGKVVKIIRDRPKTAEGISAQKELCSRLSMPKPIYIRKEDMQQLQRSSPHRNQS